MKKFFAIVLSLSLAVGLSSCGTESNDKDSKITKKKSEESENAVTVISTDSSYESENGSDANSDSEDSIELYMSKDKIVLAEDEVLSGEYVYTLTCNNFDCKIAEPHATLLKYYGVNSNIVVPADIDGYSIGHYDTMVYDEVEIQRTLKTVDLSNLDYVSDYLFEDCGELESVTFNDNCESIGSCTFDNCKSLKNIELPPNLKSIGFACFRDSSVTKITIPKTVQSTNHPFEDSAIEEITFEDGTEVIPSYICDGAKNLKNVTIPDSVYKIEESAFASCKSLEEVTIPATTANSGWFEIGWKAFEGCTNLKKVTIYADYASNLDYIVEQSPNVVFYIKEGSSLADSIERGANIPNYILF